MKTVEHLDKERIKDIMSKCDICFVGMVDGDTPYVLPMNFGYDGKSIYLHSAPHGRAIDILEANSKVCVSFSCNNKIVYQHPEVACSYRMTAQSIVAWGKVRFEDDIEKKRDALNILMAQYSDKEFKYSEPALKNVKVWVVDIDEITCKEFGTPHDKYKGDNSVKRTDNIN